MTSRAGDLLAPVVTVLSVIVALAYVVAGLGLIVWAWHMSAGWCAATLAFFVLRRLAGRR